MHTHTDATMAAYAVAAGALPPAIVRDAMDRCARLAPHPDDDARALPHVLIALHKRQESGREVTVEHVKHAARLNLRSATRERLARWERERVAELDDAATDVVAPVTATATTYEDVRGDLPTAHRVILDAVAGDALDTLIRNRARSHRTMPNGQVTGTPVHEVITGERRALKVTPIARAIGAPMPRTRQGSDALRVAACVAWAQVSVRITPPRRTRRVPVPSTSRDLTRRWTYVEGEGESVESRAARALRYVITDPAHLSRVWQDRNDGLAGATPDTATPDTVRKVGWVAPLSEPNSSETRSMPEPRKGAARRSRKGVSVPSTSTRYAGGLTEGMAHGALVAGVGTDSGISGVKREVRAMARDDAAHDAHAARLDSHKGECARPVDDGYPLTLGYATRCNCGGSTLPLRVTLDIPADDPTSAPQFTYRHALTPCPVPVTSEDKGTRCGCGRKRGALTRHGGEDVWRHRAR